jgi:hypothetical protein
MESNFAIPQPLDVDFDEFFDLTCDGLTDEELLSADHVVEGTINASSSRQTDLDIESLHHTSIPVEFTTPGTFPETMVHSLSLFF